MRATQESLKTITVALVALVLCLLVTKLEAKKSDAEVFADIKKYENCVLSSVFNYIMPEHNPPKTAAEFERFCKRNADGFKCLREQTKGAEALIRRGLTTLAATRARQNKKLCPNPNSEFAKSFIATNKCMMDRKLDQLKELDKTFFKNMNAILLKNYDDAAPELKQVCCALHDFKQGLIKIGIGACPEHKAMVEELAGMVVTDDTTLVCEDEEKLAKSCPKLERLPTDKIPDPKVGIANSKLPTSAVATMYLFATLGEPSSSPIRLD